MNALDLARKLNWEILQPDGAETEIRGAYTSDLLSDVMAHAPADGLLITIQANINTVAVATLVHLRALVVCHRRPAPDDFLAAARREGVAVFRTTENQYRTSVRVAYALND